MTLLEAMDADLDAIFFTDDELANTITYVSSNGVQKDLQAAVFDDEDELIEGTLVSVWCKVSDVPNISKGDVIIWRNEPMDIIDFRPDEFNDIMKIFINRKKGT